MGHPAAVVRVPHGHPVARRRARQGPEGLLARDQRAPGKHPAADPADRAHARLTHSRDLAHAVLVVLMGSESRAPLQRLSVHSGQQKQRQGDLTPCHFQSITHRGTCGKARVVPHNRRPGCGFMEWVTRRCVRCCRRMTRAGGGRNEMRACQTRGSAEPVMLQALPAIAVQRSTDALEVSR